MNKIKFALAALIVALLCAGCGGGGGASVPNNTNASVAQSDARNGTYQLFATDGQMYSLTLNFNASTFEVTGTGLDQEGKLNAIADGSFHFIPANGVDTPNANVRYANDIVVGGFPFNGTIKAFIGARHFISDVNALSGDFNLFGLDSTDLSGSGFIFPLVTEANFSSGTILQCHEPGLALASCTQQPEDHYTLSISGDVFTATGVDPTPSIFPTPQSFSFMVAQSGNDMILLSVARGQGLGIFNGSHFIIGLPNTASLSIGTYIGPSSFGQWFSANIAASTITLQGLTDGNGDPISSTQQIGSSPLINQPTGISATAGFGNEGFFYVMSLPELAVTVDTGIGGITPPGAIAFGVP